MVEIVAGLLLLTVSSAMAGLGPVDPEDFLAIKPGDSYSEVSKRFGHDLRHPEVRRNAEVKDCVKAFKRTQIAPPKRVATAPEKVNGVLLIPDASVAETAAICERLEKRGIRFEVRQTVIDNTCHIFGGNYAGTSGNGTRMCIYVRPDDCPEAERCWLHLKG